MLRTFLSICLLTIIANCGFLCNNTTNFEIKKDSEYPKWVCNDSVFTNQTSGIAFIEENNNGKLFLIVDDIGKIHKLTINKSNNFEIKTYSFNFLVSNFLNNLAKADFEEIAYDKNTGEVYLSIEGNGANAVKDAGIYKISFYNNDLHSDSIIALTKLEFKPVESISKYISDNIGFEGFTMDENFFYVGLEGFSQQNVFADSTIIYVIDKKNLNIVKEINTKEFGINTICGLFSYKNNAVLGIDRNMRKIFRLEFNNNFEVTSWNITEVKSAIPGFNNFEYVASLESITMDNENSIYLIDDPWTRYFIPSNEVLKNLDQKTIGNFKKFIPVIYKYQIIF